VGAAAERHIDLPCQTVLRKATQAVKDNSSTILEFFPLLSKLAGELSTGRPGSPPTRSRLRHAGRHLQGPHPVSGFSYPLERRPCGERAGDSCNAERSAKSRQCGSGAEHPGRSTTAQRAKIQGQDSGPRVDSLRHMISARFSGSSGFDRKPLQREEHRVVKSRFFSLSFIS